MGQQEHNINPIRQGCIDALRKVKELNKAYHETSFEHGNMDQYQHIKNQLLCAQSGAIIWLQALCDITEAELLEVKP